MGKAKKAEREALPLQFPQSVLDQWRAIVCNQPHYKATPLGETVAALADSSTQSWDQQVGLLRKAGKLLPENKTPVAQETGLVKAIAVPFVCYGYLGCPETPTRRFFLPLINQLATFDLADRFVAIYRDYISSQNPLFGDHTYTQRATSIRSLLDFPVGQDVLSRLWKETMVYLIESLDATCNHLKATDVDTTTDSPMVRNTLTAAKTTRDIQQLTKSILTLLARDPDQARALFPLERIQANGEAIHTKRLVAALFDICTETDIYTKDCCQTAGMALASLLDTIQDPCIARDLVVGWFFSSNLPASVKAASDVVGVPSHKLTQERGWVDRSVPMLAVVRGLVSSLKKQVLLEPIPSNIELSSLPLESQRSYGSLQEVLFYCLDYFCRSSDIHPPSKVMAFESMAMWLTSWKSFLLADPSDPTCLQCLSTLFVPATTDRLLHYVWNHWDDPIDAIQYKVRTIFEATLDLLEIKAEIEKDQATYDTYIGKLLRTLLDMDWHQKVKYPLLSILVPKLGTATFLRQEPHFVRKCLVAMDSLNLSPQVTTVVLAFLYKAADEICPGCVAHKGKNARMQKANEAQVQQWIDVWKNAALTCLSSSSELMRRNVSSFILPPLFQFCPESFWSLAQALSVQNQNQGDAVDVRYRLHAFVAVAKVGRSLDIVEGDAYGQDESSSKPFTLSTSMLKLAIHHFDPQVRLDVLELLCESRKTTAPVTRTELDLVQLFLPLNMSCTLPDFRQRLCTYISRLCVRLKASLYALYRTQKSRKLYLERGMEKSPEAAQAAAAEIDAIQHSLDYSIRFLFWLYEHTMTSLYPGSSFQRISTALRLFNTLVKVFEEDDKQTPSADLPFRLPIYSARSAKLLVDTLGNPYDFNRAEAFAILCNFPAALPGIDSFENAQKLLWSSLTKVTSTRAGESESGAMLFRLVFSKYVVGLGYSLNPDKTRSDTEKIEQDHTVAAVAFTQKLLDLLEKQMAIARENLLLAAQHYPLHGTFLALQYVFEEIDRSTNLVLADVAAWRSLYTRAFTDIHAVRDIVGEVLCDQAPEGNMPSSVREADEMGENEDLDSGEFGPAYQIILSCCWRAVKEASALLETLVSKAPIGGAGSILVETEDVVKSGELLRQLLTTVRHRGAFSAVYPAYVSLNVNLLQSRDNTLAKLPVDWLQADLESLVCSNVSITRRSAGLPLCILAVVGSEKSTRKPLLDKTMKRLFNIAETIPPVDADQRIDLPQVHAYNVLRTIFMDAKLAERVLEYAAQGFSLAISGFSSNSWAIRNCAVMLFSTLLQRTFGAKKTRDEHSNVNKLTGREFFTRYPRLHPYLLQELKTGVDQLLSSNGGDIHPGLYPILTLLSRLHPSVMDGTDNVLAMSAFAPHVMACSRTSIYKTREMTARALVPLITSNDLTSTVVDILSFPTDASQNEIHGRLLQVQFLLRGHLYNPSLREPLIDFGKRVPSLLEAILVEAASGKFSNMTYALLLDLVSEFFFDGAWLTVERDNSIMKALQDLTPVFESLRRTAWQTCIGGVLLDTPSLVGAYLVRTSMARIVLQGSLQGLVFAEKLADVLFLLDDADYEVRLETMKRLEKHFSSKIERSVEEIEALHYVRKNLLLKTYEGESNQECFVFAARFLLTFTASGVALFEEGEMAFTHQDYWNRLVEQFGSVHSQSVSDAVLPLLGALLTEVMKTSDAAFSAQCLDMWTHYVIQCSVPSSELPLRESAVESIRYMANTVFSTHQDPHLQKSQNTMKLCIAQLLQDDDIDIRDMMAESVSNALGLSITVHPERALELIYQHLIKHTVEYNELRQALLQQLLSERDLDAVYDEELATVKPLFAKENPNIFKEDLVDTQWLYLALDKLCDNSCITLLKPAGLHSAKQVSRLLKKTSQLSMIHGPYGVTSRPGIFIAAYANIMAATLLFSYASEDADITEAGQELSRIIDEVQDSAVHPVLWQIICGREGLSAKLDGYLARCGKSNHGSLFLITPDARKA